MVGPLVHFERNGVIVDVAPETFEEMMNDDFPFCDGHPVFEEVNRTAALIAAVPPVDYGSPLVPAGEIALGMLGIVQGLSALLLAGRAGLVLGDLYLSTEWSQPGVNVVRIKTALAFAFPWRAEGPVFANTRDLGRVFNEMRLSIFQLAERGKLPSRRIWR